MWEMAALNQQGMVWQCLPQIQLFYKKAFCVSSVSTAVFMCLFSCVFSQLGPNVKELFRLVEDFVDVIGLRMKDFQDMYEVTDNLGQPYLHPGDLYSYLCLSKQIVLSQLFFLWGLVFITTMAIHKREDRGGWPDG